jgi:1-acyl-sn-glycerol-3-phosphate acyltransferase
MVSLRSLVYLGYLFLTVVLFSIPIAVLGWVVPYKWLAEAGRLWGNINLIGLSKICGLNYRVSGKENLPISNCIVLCKHQSAWETIALRALLPAEHTWVLKRELLWVPFFGWGLAPYRPIAIDRKAGRRAAVQLVQQGRHWLEQGRWIVIFPEGTRVNPGDRKRYGIGGALLAEKTAFPVLPIAHNAGVFWRRRDYRKYPGTIDLVIGEVMETKGLSAAQINRRVEQWIETTVARLPDGRSLSP